LEPRIFILLKKFQAMRFSIAAVIIFLFPVIALGQTDIGKPLGVPAGSGIKIPPASTPSTISPSTSSPSLFDNPPKPAGSISPEPLNLNFGKTTDFSNPNKPIEDKLNSVNYVASIYDVGPKRNQFLGEVRVKSEIVRITYRDFGEVDGDIVRVYVNGEVALRAVVLDGGASGFDVTLQKGTNRLEFEALNEGSQSPNTAEFTILDDRGEVIFSNRWDISTGYKASVNVIRE
jgi:hypothetical protein